MARFKIFLSLVAVPIVIAGCASTGGSPSTGSRIVNCAAAGAAGGAVIGAASNDGEGKSAAVGAAGGALVGALICGGLEMQDSDGDGVPNYRDDCPGTPAGVKVDERGCPLDSDGDGVPDYLDKCPDTPAGVAVDEQGCPIDSDGDGVPDYLDQCPNTPRGMAVDGRGCPVEKDTDGDGVGDSADRCPYTPSGVRVDADGCPPVGEILVMETMEFDFDSAKIRDVYKPRLLEHVQTLKNNPNIKVLIEGHTDSTGPEAYNRKLSERRANAVKDFAAANGIDSSRMTTIGKGESEPIATNDTKEGRSKNRRVEFTITEK